MNAFLETWKAWADLAETATSDQNLAEDQATLAELKGDRRVVQWNSWAECRDHFDPWTEVAPLHTGLVPLPFVGDVRQAKVYFLLLNPGLSATDYHAEYAADGFRARLLGNLRQDFAGTDYPFYPLDPKFAWHSGNAFWERKLRHVAGFLSTHSNFSPPEVRKFLAKTVCAIEMLPYHSVRLDLPHRRLEKFHSVALARECVKELVPRAQAGDCLIVAMRQVTNWAVPLNCANVLRFTGGQARAAHLSTKDEKAHGTRIAKFLLPELTRHFASTGQNQQADQSTPSA